jgi:hypothetical protein
MVSINQPTLWYSSTISVVRNNSVPRFSAYLLPRKIAMRCSRLLRAARPTTEGVFGKFELLRPPKIRKSTGSSGDTKSAYVPPSPVPSRIIRPSYVPVNLFTRKAGDEALAEAPPDDLEGYHGEAGVGNIQTGVIPLGGMEERSVRYSGALVAEILDQVRMFVKVSCGKDGLW